MSRLPRLVFTAFLAIGIAFIAVSIHPVARTASELPTSPLNVSQFQQTLDRKDVAGAVRLVELGWSYQYETYYGGRLTTRVLPADAISRRLAELSRTTGKRTALIYAIPTPQQLELIIVPPGARPTHHRLTAVNRETLVQFVQAFRDEVMDPNSSRSSYLPPAQRLYRILISPLERELKAYRINTLIFCLGGGLRTVPLAALHDGERFLAEKYNLAIIPAFNLLDPSPSRLKGTEVLAMGASQFEEQTPLPAVPLELATIAQKLWSGTVLLNQNFTLNNLRTYRAKTPYAIVHLATHADFAPGSITNSYIQFWNQRLSPNNFRDLNLRDPAVQLLVLSACRTAVGNPQAELGFAGLAIMSGSKSAIASLWLVSDTGTLVLMTEFYRQLKITTNQTTALRLAQIGLLRKQVNLLNSPVVGNRPQNLPPELENDAKVDFSHPYYWAAFSVIGSPW